MAFRGPQLWLRGTVPGSWGAGPAFWEVPSTRPQEVHEGGCEEPSAVRETAAQQQAFVSFPENTTLLPDGRLRSSSFWLLVALLIGPRQGEGTRIRVSKNLKKLFPEGSN